MIYLSWTNPYPLGQGRAESLKVVMQTVMEGHEYTEEQKVEMRVMYRGVMAGTALLADYRKLADRIAPEPPPLPEIPVKVFTNEDFVF